MRPWVKETLAEAELKDKIRTDVSEGLEKTQREFLLRQQMDAIKKELGEDDVEDVVAEYRKKLDEANMPEDVARKRSRDRTGWSGLREQNPEHGWIRTYLDWMVEMPWDKRTEDQLEVTEARRILDEDHAGLEDVKDRIVEYLAVRKLRHERGMRRGHRQGIGSDPSLSSVLPGSGRPRSASPWRGQWVASSFAMSLGGVRDEAEIRGHRRTYIGALPGRIARALKEAGTKNPVFMLDEVDKVGSDWRGDPSSALLEVLDPAQNHSFRDHYLEVDLDLSEVMFICTANMIETIPAPLLDRMEIIRIDGYTEYEKVEIAAALPRRDVRSSATGSRQDEIEIRRGRSARR